MPSRERTFTAQDGAPGKPTTIDFHHRYPSSSGSVRCETPAVCWLIVHRFSTLPDSGERPTSRARNCPRDRITRASALATVSSRIWASQRRAWPRSVVNPHRHTPIRRGSRLICSIDIGRFPSDRRDTCEVSVGVFITGASGHVAEPWRVSSSPRALWSEGSTSAQAGGPTPLAI